MPHTYRCQPLCVVYSSLHRLPLIHEDTARALQHLHTLRLVVCIKSILFL